MKMTNLCRRLLSILLVLTMLGAYLVPLSSAENAPAESEPESYEIDPATLHVQRLGEGPDTEEAENAEAPLPYKASDLVRVSILLEEPSASERYDVTKNPTSRAVNKYREQLHRNQDDLQKRIEQKAGQSIDVKWNLTLLTNLISANVRYGDLAKIEAVPGVKSVTVENRYEAPSPQTETAQPQTANSSQYMVGAFDAWDNGTGYTGAGTRVAIVVTGLDLDHQSVNAAAFDHAIEEVRQNKAIELFDADDLAAIQSNAEVTLNGTGIWHSSKIPYIYNYVDNDTDVTHLNDTQGEHGSHVAGISAANRYLPDGSGGFTDAASTVYAVGMAPDAQLFVMKVFGKNGGAYDSDYMAAIEDAIALGCDTVNLSLGSSIQGWTYSGTYQDILNRLDDSSINLLVSISAGNSYALDDMLETPLYIEDIDEHTGGSPGTFVNSLCVAAAENTGVTGMPLVYNDKYMFYTETSSTGAAMTSAAGTWDFVYIDAAGLPADYAAVQSALSLENKLVIVNRGLISFYEKGNNLIDYKPKALIVANNQGGSISMALDDYTGTFPMVSILLSDANLIKATAQSHTVTYTDSTNPAASADYTYYTGSLTVMDTMVSELVGSNAEITAFSSWGIAGSLLMKPEITAPGGDIYSIFGTNKTDSGNVGGTDQYELMSGTSMAAPHIAGLGAVLAQYLKENNVTLEGYSLRGILQSLLMSTAVPMHIGSEDGPYYPILQQGAGLVNVNSAIQAKSILTMEADATLSWADGKVKAELGDKPARSGSYSYSFTVHNTTDRALTYALSTDLFTQARVEYGDEVFMDHSTTALRGWNVSYSVNGLSCDVDRDGDTDTLDAQAILDYVVGKNNGQTLDLAAADLDGDHAVSSYDAHLLLELLAQSNTLTVPANGKRTVTVTIAIPADTSALDADYPCGCYVEGFTYVTCTTTGENSKPIDVQHSIPLLGFYGSWTDPSMFDNTSYVDTLYSTEKTPYSGRTMTNYLTLTQSGNTVKFSGNPYMVESSFPADRLAVNSGDTVNNIYYNLIRAAAGTAFAAGKLDANGTFTEVLASNVLSSQVDGIWFNQSSATWQNTGTKGYTVNRSAAGLGLQEGDRFRVGFYAIPEYNCMLHADNLTAADASALTQQKLNAMLLSGELGKGAFVGYDFTVDDTAPVLGTPVLTGSTLRVSATDNENLAYVAVLSLDGTTKYGEAAPGAGSYEADFDVNGAIANARGYVAVFAADYAGNETAVAVKVNDNTAQSRMVYVLTDTLEAGKNYLIVNRNDNGDGYALSYTSSGLSRTVTSSNVYVKAGIPETGSHPFIEGTQAASTAVWTASAGIKLQNDGNYLRRLSDDLTINTVNTYNSWTYAGSALTQTDALTNKVYYLAYSSDNFILRQAYANIYLYVETTLNTDLAPTDVTSVSLTPDHLDLYKGNTSSLTAKVLPLTTADPSVVWTTSDPTVASVDANGTVTANAPGSATITATSNADPTVHAACSVSVVSIDKTLDSVIWDENGGVYFSEFNTNNLPSWQKLSDTDLQQPLVSALLVGDTDLTADLYAATLSSDLSGSTVYTVNKNTYEISNPYPNYVAATDMALGFYNTHDLGLVKVNFVYTYACFLLGGSIEPSEYEGVQYTGLPYAFLDCRETAIGDAYLAAIACKERTLTKTSFYVLDETGKIWQTTMSGLILGSNGITFSDPELVIDTGIATSFLYQNLYYDGTYLYWSHTDGDTCELIIIDLSTGIVYHAGNFGENVWPVGGLFVKSKLAPAAVGEVPMETPEEPAASAESLAPVIDRDELLTEDILARFAAEGARFAARNEPANHAAGSLNAVCPVAVRAASATPASDPLEIDLTITEATLETNGLYAIDYDGAELTYVSAESDAQAWAVYHDAANHRVLFAYASAQPFTADTALGVLHFSHTEYALATTASVRTLERGDGLSLLEPAETVPMETFAVKGVTLTLNGRIGVNCYLSIPDAQVDGLKAIVTTLDAAGETVTVSEKLLSVADKKDNGFYKFSAELPAKDMLTPVTLVLKRGETVVPFLTDAGASVDSYSFTVQQYLNAAIASPDRVDAVYPGLSTLCKMMSDYGHYAQLHFNYHLTDGAWTSGTYCDSELGAVSSLSGYSYTGTSSGSGIAFIGSSLLLKGGTKIRLFFELTGVSAANFLAYIDGSATGVALTQSSGATLYYVEIDDIHAKLLDVAHSVVVSDGNGNSATVTGYSAYSYIQEALKGGDGTLQNVVRALYLYGEKAKVFFRTNNAAASQS